MQGILKTKTSKPAFNANNFIKHGADLSTEDGHEGE